MPTDPAASSRPLNPAILDMIRCPLTRSRLRQDGDWLVAEVGGLRYPIREGFPVMLVEEAKLPEGVASIDELRQRLKGQGIQTT